MSSHTMVARLRETWLANPKADMLAGAVVALALIPEAIAFSIIAGVDPKVGLYASFLIAVVSAFCGGRPAMISAATGAMALVMVTLVKHHGLEYLFAATLLTGVLQIVFGYFKLARYMKFVPRPVMIGFVNALAILIFMAQLPQFEGATAVMYGLVALSLVIIYGLPRLTTVVPSPLVAIVAMTALTVGLGLHTRTVGDMGALPTAMPFFHLPQVPLTLETLQIILPYAAALALVGLIESLLTASIVDDMTDTNSDKHRESKSQGIANIVTGFFGGMAGCAMIGQSVINVKSGGRGRLSTLAAGVLLMLFILLAGDWVARIPMAALVAVMFMVSFSTFDWGSIKRWRLTPVSESIVMVATVATTIATHNLAQGVMVGVVLAALFFARQVSHLASVTTTYDTERETRVYRVHGELFFASTEGFVEGIDFHEHPKHVEIDLTDSHIWDGSAIAAIDKIVLKLRATGSEVSLIGLNEASATLHDQLATHHKTDPLKAVAWH
ncbi:MAG: SulP family inorganic anion transporter [Candidatus Sericytochromatia bacterium]